jgi:hypothetical protein
MPIHQGNYSTNVLSNDRTIKLKVKDGMKPETATGVVDNRLFKGENALHAVRQETGLWKLRIEHGSLPPVLADSQWTKFQGVVDAVETYFGKRNIEIAEISQ